MASNLSDPRAVMVPSRRLPGRKGLRLNAVAAVIWALPIVGIFALELSARSDEVSLAGREVFWNIRFFWLVYFLFAIMISFLLFWGVRRSYLWRLGKPVNRVDHVGARLKAAITLGLLQRRLPRDPVSGLAHLCISSSIVVLTLVTTTLFIDHYAPGVLGHFLHGPRYLGFSLVGDAFGFIGLFGIGLAAWLRIAVRKRRLQWDHRWEDIAIAASTGLLIVSGFLIEGLRIAADEIGEHEFWSYWSPGGWLVAKAAVGLDLSDSLIHNLHLGIYWFHIPLAFGWMAIISLTKLNHVLTAPTNAFLRSTRPVGRLEPIKDFETAESFGVGKVEDFTWKQLFESDVCVRCGRCSNACPAHTAGQPLSPMAIIQGVRAQMGIMGPQLVDMKRGFLKAADVSGPALVGETIADEALWACRTCGACVQECPVLIEHIPTIIDMRRWLVMDQARMPETVQATLQNLEQRGHPWRGTALTRTSWMETIGFEVPEFDGTQEYLYWVGCTGALVDRNVPITQSIVRLFHQAGLSYGVLSSGETCNGDAARRLGNEFLFQMLAEQNIATLKEKGVQKVITNCPHCFNTFKNEYPDFGMTWEVYHHTEVLDRLLTEGKIQPKAGLNQAVTFHDSCYLGRQNGIYEAPRNILRQLPMVDLIEMPRNGSKGLCCGAGGGNMFMEEKGERRVNVIRAEEAQATGADAVATSCPFCIQMFEAGIPMAEADESRRIKAFDVAELLEASTGAPS